MIVEIPLRVSNVSGPVCSNCGCHATEHDFEVTMQLTDRVVGQSVYGDQYQVQYLTIPGACQNWECKKICLHYDRE